MSKSFPKLLLITLLTVFIFQMFAILFLLITPLFVRAADPPPNPTYNPACWREAQCRAHTGCTEPYCWEKHPSCTGGTGEWGRCYPKTAPIPLQIQLQGTEEVVDIADYIARLYKYTVGIGGILATVMIIFGGIVYLTAGGNPTRIGQAKEFISNALIGVVLLFTSYLLLQTLNPDLVKLSMPRVYLIRQRLLGQSFCEDLQPVGDRPLKFALAARSGAPEDIKPFLEIQASDYQPKDPWLLPCGSQHYEESTGDEVCMGLACTTGEACGPVGDKFKCERNIAVYGKLSKSGVTVDYFDWLAYAGDETDAETAKYTLTENFYTIKRIDPVAVGWVFTSDTEGYFLHPEIKDPDILGLVDDKCYIGPLDCANLTTEEQLEAANNKGLWKPGIVEVGGGIPPVRCDIILDSRVCNFD